MNLKIFPLTPKLWPAMEDLFEDGKVCGRCWCMYWRIGPVYRKQTSAENKDAFFEIVQHRPPPGLLAFDGEKPVGWCQLTPRDALSWLERTPNLKAVDDLRVWCVSCFYIRKRYRKQGVTSALIRGALDAARKAGAKALEAYPLDKELTPSATSTGYSSTFRKLGFKEVARHTPPRPIMRYVFERR